MWHFNHTKQLDLSYVPPKSNLSLPKLLVACSLLSLSACGSDQPNDVTSSSSTQSTGESSIDSSSSVSSTNNSNTQGTVYIQEHDSGLCTFSGAVESEHAGYTGAGFINTDNSAGSGIIYQINSPNSDTYELSLRYANGGSSRSARIIVNDGAGGEIPITFAAGAWDSWQELVVPIDLINEANKIEIVSDSSEGLANIDRMGLSGDQQAEAGSCSNITSSSSSSSPANNGAITGASCQSTGSTTVNETIIVASGQSYDGGCRTFNPTSALGDGSQNESQKPVFRIENGATLRNVIIGNNGADGIHVYGNATIENITWTNVGEDALTIKSSGTVNIRNISGYNGEDKFFQINAASTLNVENCIIDRAGKALRQNGGTTFKVDISFNRCDIRNMGEGVFRTDSTTSTARITNSKLSNAGSICIGNWASCTSENITYY